MTHCAFWGIYFPPDKAWLKRPDGELFFYPSPHIAQAHLMEMQNYGGYKTGVVREFNEPFEQCSSVKQNSSVNL